jgi:hypothetical protein
MKKLWLLRPVKDADPWRNFHNCTFGHVVREDSEIAARIAAGHAAGDEGPQAWRSPQFSTCEELTGVGPAGVIMSEYVKAS